MTFVWIVILAALLGASTVASYLRLLMRRLTAVGALKLFQAGEGRRIQADRERVSLSLSALHGAAMGLFAIALTGLLEYRRPDHIWINLGVAVLAVMAAIAVCDQLIPFRLVARHDEPEVILQRWMPVLRLAVLLALPLTFSVLVSTTIARLLEPPVSKSEGSDAQGEFQELIEAGEQEGLIEKGEGKLLQSVVEFGDKIVREVMTPRPEIAALEIDSPVEELRRLLRERRQTRYPVYSGQLDNLEGIVNVRDLIELPLDEQAKVTLRSLVRPVLFVPETKPTRELLKELQRSATQMAVVIDEYGSVAGLVTIKDLVEEIVGEIRDESEPRSQDIVREPEGSYLVAGQTELSQVADVFRVSIEGRDYSTVAGLMLTQLGHVPAPGEKTEKSGLAFEVLDANERTVLKVRIRVLARAAAPIASSHVKRPFA